VVVQSEQRPEDQQAPGSNTCAGLADDERLALMRLLVGTHARLTRVLGSELERACGLPLTWFVALVRLASAPDNRLTMGELSSELALTSGGVTRMVDRMVERQLVERQHCPSDRRSVYVALTAQGANALDEATATHLEGLDRHLIGPLNETDRIALVVALTKLGTDPTGGCPGG
jgi:DNA-binding MarR family transcriptional regulator